MEQSKDVAINTELSTSNIISQTMSTTEVAVAGHSGQLPNFIFYVSHNAKNENEK